MKDELLKNKPSGKISEISRDFCVLLLQLELLLQKSMPGTREFSVSRRSASNRRHSQRINPPWLRNPMPPISRDPKPTAIFCLSP
jgi:hypothetical protein